MSDKQTSNENENASESESAEVETTTEPAGESTESQKDEETREKDELDELPEWARKRLTKANTEAGKYRTQLREVEQKLAQAKSPEEYEAATKALREANAKLERDLLVERVARKAKLPEELAELLQGSTEEELQAHAKKLSKFAPADDEPGELRGGLDPNDEDDFDPVKVAHAARRTRY
ncbi:hypothetical protein [Actinoplanes sp. NPDC026670]|uniref:hypothetical protein n=1 Tax=Actinoplanes sp. NPDC026670 TaxID=3154700 RepID=UPI0033FAAA38